MRVTEESTCYITSLYDFMTRAYLDLSPRGREKREPSKYFVFHCVSTSPYEGFHQVWAQRFPTRAEEI